MASVRVLIVDDSATMRGIIAAALRKDPEIEVVGAASDPYQAREAIKELSPDVVTLDVEMPRMNGVEFLEKLMRLRPTPTIMISTLTQRGAALTIEALRLGAFDCVGKPTSGDMSTVFEELPAKVKAAAMARVRKPQPAAASEPPSGFNPNTSVVCIGSSTGGVDALSTVLSRFPANCPPTLVTQHMMQGFIASFAARLDKSCAPKIDVARDGEPLKPGRVYIAPGGETHLEVVGSNTPACRLRAGDLVSGHRPSVDVLFSSAANILGPRCVGVILTGMGADGADGLLKIREAGGRTIGQNEDTCVVYGMPRVAYERGGVERQSPLGSIAEHILTACSDDTRRYAS